MNIQTDVVVTPSSLDKCSWQSLLRIAHEGSACQKMCLIDWAYGSIPAAMHEELYYIVNGVHYPEV